MFIHLYTYTYTCTYIYRGRYTHRYIYTNKYMYTHVYVCILNYANARATVYMIITEPNPKFDRI